MAKTTISIDQNTREQLKEVGLKGQSYDEVLSNLLSVHKLRSPDELIRFDDELQTKFNEFRAKASLPFLEKGENLPTAHLIRELVRGQISNINRDKGTCIMGRTIVT